MRCTDCNFIKLDGDIFCLLDMHKIVDIYEKKECNILYNYRKEQEKIREFIIGDLSDN